MRFCFSVLLAIFLLSDVLTGWATLIPAAHAAPATLPAAQSQVTFQQFLKLSQQQYKTTPFAFSRQAPQNQHTAGEKLSDPTKLPPSAEPATMTPISQPLTTSFLAGASGGTPLDLAGSDQRLEIQIPSGALDVSQASIAGGTKPGGALTLHVSQLHGHFAGQVNMLGSYSMQVVDAAGHPVSGIRLRTPVTFLYHYQPSEIALLDLDPDRLLMSWPDLTFAARQAHQPISAFTIPLHNDARTHTLSGQSSVLGSGVFDMGGGDPANQSPPTPHYASVQGNSGQLTYGYPLSVPPGPPGTAPDLTLAYSSQSTNDRHSQTSPTGSVGEGWALSMGAITADQYPSTSAGHGTWYFISGVDHVSDRLMSNDGAFFQTEHISNLRVHLFTPAGRTAPCFQVWDTTGAYYEFGCTTDSFQYHTVNGAQQGYEWDLNHVTPPNQGPGTDHRYINLTYLQDLTSAGVRSSALKQIVYGTTTGTQVAGTIDFFYWAPYAQSPWTLDYNHAPGYYGSNALCPPTPAHTSLRCDDPLDFAGGLPAPTVLSTYTLKTITSYVGDDSSSTHAATGYSFDYLDLPFRGCWDDFTQTQEYCAGSHLLQKVTPTMYQNGTAHPLKSLDLTYTPGLAQNTYSDDSQTIPNGQHYQQQTFWNYLINYVDTETGVGGNITYQTAYNNTHGTPMTHDQNGNLENRYDPLYCSLYTGCRGPGFDPPDDRAWTNQVVSSITTLGKDSSATGLAPATTTYHYHLTKVGGSCPSDSQTQDCVDSYWSPQSSTGTADGDWIDFYHGEFHGFHTVYTVSPANDTTAQVYATTDGWNTQESGSGNYTAGQVEEEDVYSGSGASAILLRSTVNTYAGNNLKHDACSGNFNLAYAPCAVLVTSSHTTFPEGSSNPTPPWVQTDNTYNGYDSTSGLGPGYQTLASQQVSGSNVATTTKQWTYLNQDTAPNGWEYYHIGLVSHSQLTDSSGHVWQCQDTTYDEGAPSGVPTPDAGWPTTTKTASNCADQAHTAITTYQAYTIDGQVVATVDGVGTANSSLYSSTGCTPSTTPFIKAPAWTASRYTSCTAYDAPYLAQPSISTDALGHTSSIAYDYTQGALPVSTTDANGQPTGTTYSYDSSGNRTLSITLPGGSGTTSQSSTNSNCTHFSTLPCFEIDNHSSLYPNAVSRTFYDSQDRKVETRTPGPGAGDDTITMTAYDDATHSTFQSQPFEVPSGSAWIDPNTATDINNTAPGGTITYYDALNRAVAVQDPSFGSPQEPGIACSTSPHLSGPFTACTNYGLSTAHGDATTYVFTQGIDPNNHMTVSFADVLGRTRSIQQYSGQSGPLSANVVQQQSVQYNAIDKPTSVQVSDLAPQSGQNITSVTTTAQYDDLGRTTQAVDPDRGTHSYAYDANGQVLTDTATSGSSARTFGYNYDLLGRAGCAQLGSPTINATGACTTGTTPLIQNTYDTSLLGGSDHPVGRLTQQVATTIFPDGSSGQVTDQMQYDARGRVSQKKLFIGVPGTWNVSSGLPSNQLTQSYNDANQPTTSVISTSDGHGYTFSQVYDGTTGVQTGLSSTSSQTANLATVSYTVNAQLASVNLLSSTGTPLATEQVSYDANLRPTSTVATWQAGSGATGTILSHARSYDLAGNVTSVNETLAAVPGVSGSGGSDLQLFCYDEQNRLVWAGNQGTAPGAGTGTCGNGTPSSSLSGGNYGTNFVATHLGQLWQGPLNGSGTQQQYLYCDSTHPHQVSALSTLGTTCATRTTGNTVYSSSYDAWGNVSSRTTGGVSATLSYDALDHLVHWDGHAGTSEDYLYDASGERVLRRVVKTTGTQFFTYPFGLMDSTYNGSGVQALENDYYMLAGRLIGERESGVTVFLLTDELGSVLTSISAAAGSAAVTSTQVYSPYGTPRYKRGTVPTEKGFTGQYRDGSGLDYYNARYYDPVVGRFVSADIKQGNAQGMDPYSYVGNNPETLNDPTGERFCSPATGECGHPCAGNCSPGDGGCSAHWHPPMAPCGGSGNGNGTPTPTPPHKTPGGTKQQSENPLDNIKSWSHLILGIGKVALGVSTLVLAFLNFTNPVMALLQFLARIVFKSALNTVIWLINDGIKNILSSLKYVDRGVKIMFDIAAVVLDLVGIFSTLRSISQAARMIGVMKDIGWSLKTAAEQAVKYFEGKISLGVVNNITRVRALSGAIPNTFLGFGQVATDFADLGVDAGWWT